MGSFNSKNHRTDSIPNNMVNNQNTNPIPQKDKVGKTGNWDEKAHMSRNIQKNIPQNERRNLNPDREKRTGSNLNPDKNSGDR